MADPTERTLSLLSLLQTHRSWPGPELAGRLGVSERTLRRDIERLRYLGYPVEATAGREGGYRLAAGAHMPPLLVDDEEAVAVAVGLRAAAAAPVAGMEETAARAMAKIEQVLPDHIRRRVNALHSSVTPMRWPHEGPAVDPGDLAVLAQGCRDNEEVRFAYCSRDGTETQRLVEPHQLVTVGRRWYLVAWDVRRVDWRTFRVDRLQEARLAGRRVTRRELPATDAAEFVARSIESAPSRYHITATLAVSAGEVETAARWLDAEVRPCPGGCELHMTGDVLEPMVGRVAMLAVSHPVRVEGSPEVLESLGQVAGRITAGPPGHDPASGAASGRESPS